MDLGDWATLAIIVSVFMFLLVIIAIISGERW